MRVPAFNPIATRTTALVWIGAWKLLDVLSTWIGLAFAGGTAAEGNVVLTTLGSYVGFDVALALTVPVTLLVVYLVHHRQPVVNEMIALTLPLVVVANVAILAGRAAWLTAVGILVLVVLGYLGYGWYVHYDPAASWREKLFGMPDPVLWTPTDVDTRPPEE